MKSVTVSVPVVAYKDFNIRFFYGDEELEERSVENFKKQFPYKSKEEGYKKVK